MLVVLTDHQKMERPASRKLSQAPNELLPEIDNDTKWVRD